MRRPSWRIAPTSTARAWQGTCRPVSNASSSSCARSDRRSWPNSSADATCHTRSELLAGRVAPGGPDRDAVALSLGRGPGPVAARVGSERLDARRPRSRVQLGQQRAQTARHPARSSASLTGPPLPPPRGRARGSGCRSRPGGRTPTAMASSSRTRAAPRRMTALPRISASSWKKRGGSPARRRARSLTSGRWTAGSSAIQRAGLLDEVVLEVQRDALQARHVAAVPDHAVADAALAWPRSGRGRAARRRDRRADESRPPASVPAGASARPRSPRARPRRTPLRATCPRRRGARRTRTRIAHRSVTCRPRRMAGRAARWEAARAAPAGRSGPAARWWSASRRTSDAPISRPRRATVCPVGVLVVGRGVGVPAAAGADALHDAAGDRAVLACRRARRPRRPSGAGRSPTDG